MTKTLKLDFPKNKKSSDIIIESGHIYTNEKPSLEHKIGATYGNLLSNYLTLFGATTTNWLFIDNYNPSFENKPEILDTKEYVSSLTELGFKPEKIMYEADLIENAKDITKYLMDKGYAGENHNGKTALYKGKILLHDPENDKYMCSLLDACLYMKKLEKSDGCITILEKQYASQQKATLAILKKLGNETSNIFPFFYTMENPNNHSSINSSNIFSDETINSLYYVKPAIELLQNIAKLSGSVSLDETFKFEVGKYEI